ncbi:MAG: 50S ribosomal protein L15 [Nanohaloarchaea archaeon QH_8_44_6]|nr:MAG: 50S ribosomal protein L15 [Nanohaloarchaea archaeon QH_8_44_6]
MTKRRSKKKKSGSHGYGSSKKNRGAGSRGGRGKAGSGKKASHDRMGKEGLKKMGEHGFKPFHENEQNGLNLRDIDQRIEELVEAGLADEEDGTFVVNLDDIGYDKVLGTGKLTKDIEIHAENFSDSAKRKIEESDGKAVIEE